MATCIVVIAIFIIWFNLRLPGFESLGRASTGQREGGGPLTQADPELMMSSLNLARMGRKSTRPREVTIVTVWFLALITERSTTAEVF